VMEEIDFKLTMKLGNSKKYEFYWAKITNKCD
jgi:hypothetical protein